MVYYKIDIFTKSRDLNTIVTEFWKFKYNIVLVELCASGDIFQYKLYELLSDIDGSRHFLEIYWYLVKFFFPHIYQLRFIFTRLSPSGFKVNYLKCSFGLKYIPCIGYIIMWEGVKPDV